MTQPPALEHRGRPATPSVRRRAGRRTRGRGGCAGTSRCELARRRHTTAARRFGPRRRRAALRWAVVASQTVARRAEVETGGLHSRRKPTRRGPEPQNLESSGTLAKAVRSLLQSTQGFDTLAIKLRQMFGKKFPNIRHIGSRRMRFSGVVSQGRRLGNQEFMFPRKTERRGKGF
jgi:hypothetical protein